MEGAGAAEEEAEGPGSYFRARRSTIPRAARGKAQGGLSSSSGTAVAFESFRVILGVTGEGFAKQVLFRHSILNPHASSEQHS